MQQQIEIQQGTPGEDRQLIIILPSGFVHVAEWWHDPGCFFVDHGESGFLDLDDVRGWFYVDGVVTKFLEDEG